MRPFVPTRNAFARRWFVTTRGKRRDSTPQFVAEAFGQFIACALKAFLARGFGNFQIFSDFNVRQTVDSMEDEDVHLSRGNLLCGDGNQTPGLFPLHVSLGRRVWRGKLLNGRRIFGESFGVSLGIANVSSNYLPSDASRPGIEVAFVGTKRGQAGKDFGPHFLNDVGNVAARYAPSKAKVHGVLFDTRAEGGFFDSTGGSGHAGPPL
jgi:hypothetical protein